jgi:signal transduction histidine kinase/CheY-like chemotaxis protein/streptogramin lyase
MLAALCLAWQAAMGAAAPPAAPVFRTFGTAEGLPSSQVQALAQDGEGRLWIGTAFGLARYDGQRLVRFLPHAERSGALPSGSVDALHVDAAGRLWVASQGARLSRVDPGTDWFQPIALPAVATGAPLELWTISSTPGRIWIGGYGTGLIELDAEGRWLARHGREAGLPSLDLTQLVRDAAGRLWLLDLERGLGVFDPVDGQYRRVPGASQVLGLGATAGGVSYSTGKGQSCFVDERLRPECKPLPQLSQPGALLLVLSHRRGLWLGGLGELATWVDGRLHVYRHLPGAVGGLPRQQLWTGIEDREGGVWIGTFGGGLLYLPLGAERFRVWQSEQGLGDSRIRGLARDGSGRIWIGTMNAGLKRLDPQSGEVSTPVWPGRSPNRVFALAWMEPGQLWVGARDGLYRLQIAGDGAIRAVTPIPALAGASVDLLYPDRSGAIWAAAMGSGVYRVDPRTLRTEFHPFHAERFAGTEAQMLGAGPDGTTWVATDRGLYRFDAACACFLALLEQALVEAFALGSDDLVHVFVDGQLVRYRWRGGLFRDEGQAPLWLPQMQSAGGLAVIDDALWLAGPQGLLRYRLDGHTTHWDERDGLPTTEFSDRPFLVDGKVLWLGSERGLVRVDTQLPDPPRSPPQLRFDRVQVAGILGERPLPTAGLVRIGATESGLTVAVRLDRLERAHAQRFAFRLDRQGADWPPAGAEPVRVFGSLSAGRHRIEVRAWDGYGVPAGNVLALEIDVATPWWRSQQAYLAYAAAVLILLGQIEAARRRRWRNAEALAEARRQSEWNGRLAAAARALIAEVGHEVRNPLNGMLGMARLIAESPLPAETRRQLALLQEAGRQLARLLDDLTDWSRLEAGRGELALQPVRLAAVLEACLARHAMAAQAKGLDFVQHLPPALVVVADPARLLQIVDNLLGNAIKYTQHGGIVVRAELLDERPPRIALRVVDSGPGLSASDLERLFQPYERLSNARHAPGVGLGLAISRGLAERMQGELRAAPAPHGGAEFTLMLVAASLPEAQAPAPAEPETPRLDGVRLLLVEDDAISAEALAQALVALGAALTHAPDSLTALTVLAGQAFDAVLLDIDLPGMGGLELARVIRARPASPPLIAISGRTTAEDRAAAEAAGIAVYLVKPVEVEPLVREILAHGVRPATQ